MQSKKFLTDVLKRDGNNFDILRLIAALGVITGHAYAIAPHPPLRDGISTLLHFDYSGSLAVKFFFFLSGLLVTNSIISKPAPFQFLLKRAFRIFPGLLVCLIISVFIIGPVFTKLSMHDYFSSSDTWNYLVHNFFLMDIVWRLPGVFAESRYGLNGSLWTLPYEVLCYIYLAFFYGIWLLRNKIIANIFFILVLVASFIKPGWLPTFFAQNPEAHLLPGCFAIGCLFANNKKYIAIHLLPAILLWALVFALRNLPVYQFLFYVVLFYSAVLFSSLSLVKNYLKLPFDASYGVYVYGFVIQQCIFNLFPELGIHEHQILAAIIAITMGTISWFLIEKRFISLGNRITDKINGIDKNKLRGQLKTVVSFFKNKKTMPKSNFIKFWVLALSAALIHAIVLKFIYPGYYSPLYPLHSDFYIPAMLAHSSDTFLNLLSWPRPINMIFAKLIGYSGIKGSIAWIIAIVCFNCAFTALLLIRLFKLHFNWQLLVAFGIYCYMLFSEPFFYIFYAQDIGAQLSYFFLISGVYFLYAFFNKPVVLIHLIFFIFCLLAFLSKETYALAALTLSFLWFIYYKRYSLIKSLLPLSSIAAAFSLTMLINFFIKSAFIDLNASESSHYRVSLNPVTIISEWFQYAKEAMNIADVIILLVIVYFLVKRTNFIKRDIIFLITCCLAGAAASWLPNALLPNHHFKGYSFNGAYLLYLPCLFLSILWINKQVKEKMIIAVILLCLINPLLNIPKYKLNRWAIKQQKIQRNLLHALKPLMKRIQPSSTPQNILIEGITYTFHPFTFPQALRVFPNAKYANFDVINYDSARICGVRTDLVRFVNKKDIQSSYYQQKWVFDEKGKIIDTAVSLIK